MKKRQFILSLGVCVTILIQACQKDTGPYPGTLADKISHSTGTLSANINGKPWVSTLARAYYWKGDRFGIVAEYYFNEYLHESLSFSYINQLLQLNSIRYRDPNTLEYGNTSGIHALFSISEDDANIATYYVIPEVNNYLEITDYDATKQEIKGRFQISFYLDYSVDKGVYDTVRLTDGVFSLKINNP